MKKFKIVMMDLIGIGMEWLDRHAERIELEELVSPSGNLEGTISLETLSGMEGWDFLFIFSGEEVKDDLRKLLHLFGIPEDKVMYPLEAASLLEHGREAAYMFDDQNRRIAEYLELHQRQSFSFAEVEGGVMYLGRSTDVCIMNYMYATGKNWALDDMMKFHELSNRYYSFSDGQDLFCDIGANIGTTSIYFKKRIDESVRILAFEPMPDTFRLLGKNMQINDVPESEFRLANIGISNEGSEQTFYYNPKNPGASSFTNDDDAYISFSMRTVRFDDYLKENGIDPHEIKYLWVDVEGFEWAFVAGAKETLREINVPLVMEVTPRLLRDQKKQETFLADIGELYSRYIVMDEEKIVEHPIDELKTFLDNDGNEYQSDLFFLKD